MKMLVRKLLYFLPILLVVAGTNFFIDPYGAFDALDRIEAEDAWIVEQLAQKRNVAYYGNWNQRLVQLGLIERMRETGERLDIAVVGSSRAMQIHSGLFIGKRFFNNTVTGADLPDAIAIAEAYRVNRVPIGTIIIGIDLWMFNTQNENQEWRVLGQYYNRFLEEYHRVSFFDRLVRLVREGSADRVYLKKRLQALVSLKYFQHSLQNRKPPPTQSEQHEVVDDADQEGPVKMADGSLMNSRLFRQKTTDDVLSEVKKYVATKQLYGLESFLLDEDRERLFEAWVVMLERDGIRPILFLPPYHPLAYGRIASDPAYSEVRTIEPFIRAAAKRANVRVIGSYDPGRVGFTNEDFSDFMHPKREAIGRLFDNEVN